jgi:hypothetical protein
MPICRQLGLCDTQHNLYLKVWLGGGGADIAECPLNQNDVKKDLHETKSLSKNKNFQS